MFIQTQPTPNPNALKFVPGRIVSNCGSHEITKKDNVKNELIRNLMSINGVEGIFLSKEFISINKMLKLSTSNTLKLLKEELLLLKESLFL